MLQLVAGIAQVKAPVHLLFLQNKHAVGRAPFSGSLAECCQNTPGFVHAGRGAQSSGEGLPVCLKLLFLCCE